MIRRSLVRFGLPVLALAALASAALSVGRSNFPQEAEVPAAVLAAPAAVAALGRVESSGGLRAVASEMSGTIAEVAVEVGDRVAPGDVLFRLQTRAAERVLAEREAALAAARASLAQVEAQGATVRADLAAALGRAAATEAQLEEAARDLDVAEQLSARDAAAGREVERRASVLAQAQAARDVALAEIARAEAVLARLDPVKGADLILARAALAEAEARRDSARSDLDALTVTAREAGVVLSLDLRAGETAGPATPVLTLAAGEGTVLRVFVEEADFPRLDTTRAGEALPRGPGGAAIPLTWLATEPEVRPNRELSGRADDRIDTRVVEVLYRLPPEAGLLVGQSLDVRLPALGSPGLRATDGAERVALTE